MGWIEDNTRIDPIAKVGMRIRLKEMPNDPNPIDEDMEGTIRTIDSLGTLHVVWDDGSQLGVIPGIDKYELLTDEFVDDPDKFMGMFGEGSDFKLSNASKKISRTSPTVKKFRNNFKKEFSSVRPKPDIKIESEDEELDETTTTGSLGATPVQPLGSKIKKESKSNKIYNIVNEVTSTNNTDFTSGTDDKFWADKNDDGWYWNDKPLWKGGEIVDLIAKISAVWDDSDLDISKEWDKTKKNYISEEKKDTVHTKKWDRCVKDVEEKNKKNKTDYNPYAVCQKSIGYEGSIKKPHRKKDKKEIEETTTFSSVFGGNFPVTPFMFAKKGKHIPSKKPLWKGGQIVQKVDKADLLGESILDEINKIKWVKGGKYVKIKDKCAKYNNQPWCSQGAIDNPLELSDTTFENIKKVSKKTGLSEEVILERILKKMGYL